MLVLGCVFVFACACDDVLVLYPAPPTWDPWVKLVGSFCRDGLWRGGG